MPDDKKMELGPLARQIMANVERARKNRRMSYAEMSEKLAEVGRPIPPLGLRRIERGERRVDTDDLAAIARVLGMPPVLLIFGVGDEPTIEVLPGVERETWQALRWFGGSAAFPLRERAGHPDPLAGTSDDNRAWLQNGRPIIEYENHERAVVDWLWEAGRIPVIQEAIEQAGPEDRKPHEDRLRKARERMAELESDLAEKRADLQKWGVVLPALPPALAKILGE